jgi:hypothetical protein
MERVFHTVAELYVVDTMLLILRPVLLLLRPGVRRLRMRRPSKSHISYHRFLLHLDRPSTPHGFSGVLSPLMYSYNTETRNPLPIRVQL